MYNTREFNSTSNLDAMRDARGNATVAFVNFVDCRDKFDDYVFCFYEGEDGKYYNQKIKSILGDKIVTIKAGRKSEVLKLWRKIKADNNYEKVRKCFFVDRDMDDIPSDIDEDLYITPCYSIENLYISKKAFGNILQAEFSCDIYENDYKKCMEKFEELLDQFNDNILEFNALVLIRKNKGLDNGRVRLNNIKTTKLLDVNLNGVAHGKDYQKYILKLKKDLKATDKEVEDSIKQLKLSGDYNNLFRGKNQLDFFVKFLCILKDLHNNESFFEKKRTSVTINPTKNRLSELSQYADFPICLINFLQNHAIC